MRRAEFGDENPKGTAGEIQIQARSDKQEHADLGRREGDVSVPRAMKHANMKERQHHGDRNRAAPAWTNPQPRNVRDFQEAERSGKE